jgi:starch-binding outer membrane protein, SusD/RagB family
MTPNKYSLLKYISTLSVLLCLGNCTKLSEHVYDQVDQQDFLQTQQNVISDFLRAFDQAFYSVSADPIHDGNLAVIEEESADNIMTPKRGGDWYNGGAYTQMHYHTWTPLHPVATTQWEICFSGVAFATNSINDLRGIVDPTKFNLTAGDLSEMIAELRTLRAWFYLRLYNLYRNIPIIPDGEVITSNKGLLQQTPDSVFNYIESELNAALPDLYTVGQFAGLPNAMGRWSQAGAASLLARLYLNAQVYIGKNRFSDCAAVCQGIINGKYGNYALDTAWFQPFDYTNTLSQEAIFGFPSSYSGSHWHYWVALYEWTMPFGANPYFSFSPPENFNPKYALQPSRDVDSNEYTFQLGKPFAKFQKYPDDYRLQKYRNLGNSQRKGMFVYGYLDYLNASGDTAYVLDGADGGAPYYLRDAVGQFNTTPPGQPIDDKTSTMLTADHNSGICVAKYPFYPDNDPNKFTSSYLDIRLAEIYYSLAECKYRAGDKAGAAVLLNSVRKRNYPAGSASLYDPSGSQLTDQEMIDEWGREFLFENRRRTDLIRWGVFNTGTWWDKQPDADDHTQILPIGQTDLNLNPQFKQNPGY